MLFALALIVIGAQSCSSPSPHPYPADPPGDGHDARRDDTDTTTDTDPDSGAALTSGVFLVEVVGVRELSGCGIRPADVIGATALFPISVRGERAAVYATPIRMRGEMADGLLTVDGVLLARVGVETEDEGDTDTDDGRDEDTAPPARGERTVEVGSAWLDAEVLSADQADGLLGYDDGECVYALEITLDRSVDEDEDTTG